ncbi:nucleotidyl transferase AbiEii/AbiGii toxin family protein [Youngiibacter multivorans]|uniref:Nucleotidyltransferase component of viral defense system n=1 Tax=Youngiibacter multivorans TaxID=937251 RepID=A0ABS4G5C3_9CLOT|nr:nucleotidyl transferase AbiEii/AbiGii toxin family protein [Youngiibacter multivorans]MBP1919765.1 putative nucleotidyltransferase component of viral defense system [Youngiibacter multivorans]
MKTSTQLKALIRNLSVENSVQSEILLRNYMLERFLERISLSDYRNHIILKGGMLIASIVGIASRSTMDMDATIRGFELSEENLFRVLNEIVDIPIEDGVTMTLGKLEPIREEAEYPGIRVSINALFDKTKQTMKLDISTGDILTPDAIEYDFKLLLENRKINILSYNLETIFAEKMETILSRGTTTTRMRDYYDIHTLFSSHGTDLNDEMLKKAFEATSAHRGSLGTLLENSKDYIEMINKSDALKRLWSQYQSKYAYASEIEWSDVMNSIKSVHEIITHS